MLRSWPEATSCIDIALIVREACVVLKSIAILCTHLDTLNGVARLIHNARLEREANIGTAILRSTKKVLTACQAKQTQ